MPEEDELVKELISNREWASIFILFSSGVAVTLLKLISSGKKVSNYWQASGAITLGGFITLGLGAFLIWLFPDMPFYIVLMFTGALSTLLESRDIHDIIVTRLRGVKKEK